MTTSSGRIAIVGAGSVGASIAYASLIRGIGGAIALYDLDGDRAAAEAADLAHGLQFVPPAQVTGSGDIGACADADVVVITAGAKQQPGQSRLDLAEANIRMCRELVPELLAVAPDAILLLVTNPVDVLTWTALEASGLPPGRVIGSGTVLDSSRLRLLVARHAGVGVRHVHAYIAGEHGDSEIALWSSASIGAVPLLQWEVAGRPAFDADARATILDEVVSSAQMIIRGKGATNHAIGLATSRILEAILADEQAVLPVSSLLSSHGVADVCLSMPSIVGRDGLVTVLPTPMDDEELAGLHRSAEAVRGVIDEAGS